MPSWDAPGDKGPVGYTDPAFEAYVWAEVQDESGGDYNATSSVGAIGAYQIMPFNVGPWSKEALGHEVTPDQFRHDHAIQDQVAQYQLLNYWNTHANLSTEDRVKQSAENWNPGTNFYQGLIWGDFQKNNFYKGTVSGGGNLPETFGGLPDKWKTPPNAGGRGAAAHGKCTTPGHWANRLGQPMADPPAGTVTYNSPKMPSAAKINATDAKPNGAWTVAQWEAVYRWCLKYNVDEKVPTTGTGANGVAKIWPGSDSKNGPITPTSKNDAVGKWTIFDNFVHTQPQSNTNAVPDAGAAQAGVGPVPNPLDLLSKLIDILSKITDLLTSGKFWRRLGLGLLGASLLGYAVFKAFGGSVSNVAKHIPVV